MSLMSNRAHSIESTRARFSSAARTVGAAGVTFTIFPPRESGIMALVATAWVRSHVPSTPRRRSSPGEQLTSVSIRPCPSRTPSTKASTSFSSSLMAQVTTRAPSASSSRCDGLARRR